MWAWLCLILGCRGGGALVFRVHVWQEGMGWLSAVCRDVSVRPTLNWSRL